MRKNNVLTSNSQLEERYICLSLTTFTIFCYVISDWLAI